MHFEYREIDSKGKRKKGVIEADSLSGAKEELRRQGVIFFDLKEASSRRDAIRIKPGELANFTALFSQLIGAGIPLFEALLALDEELKMEPYFPVVRKIRESVREGASLSEAMKLYPDSFSPLYTGMIAAGEASGALDTVLKRLAQFLTKQEKLKKQIANALIYPLILSIFALIVIALLLGFVVPSIEGIFEGRELNGFTEFVLLLSRFFREGLIYLLPFAALMIAFLVFSYKKRGGKQKLERFLMKVPLLKTLLIESAMLRFTRTLSTLQEGGLPLVEGLSLSRDVVQNQALSQEILEIERRIIAGDSLSEAIKTSLMPQMAKRMIRVGEETGHLSLMLGQVADIYEEHLERTIERGLTLLQPIILIVLGAIIGLVLLAILLPMTDISSLTG